MLLSGEMDDTHPFADRKIKCWSYHAWKGFDGSALDRLHAKGMVSDPKNKNTSVALTDEGVAEVVAAFQRCLVLMRWVGDAADRDSGNMVGDANVVAERINLGTMVATIPFGCFAHDQHCLLDKNERDLKPNNFYSSANAYATACSSVIACPAAQR